MLAFAPVSVKTWVNKYQNVTILDFVAARDGAGGGSDNCNLMTCKAPDKLSPSKYQHSVFLQARSPSPMKCRSTEGVKATPW